MRRYGADLWKRTPFLKLLLAMMTGILLQWYCRFDISVWIIILPTGLSLLLAFFFIPLFNRYRFSFVNAVVTALLFISTGAILAWSRDTRNDEKWFGNFLGGDDALVVSLDEIPVEKTRSVKAVARVNYFIRNGKTLPVKGKLILYFSKDSLPPINYGEQLIFKKPVQEIRNAGNPGGFNYKRYALFQGITHQVYLKQGEFERIESNTGSRFRKFIYSSREKVLAILRSYIKGEKELGLSEALLIGYKNDLDQSLVQAYTNTGVVHIIAISGLHLGLIYWLLALLLKPLQQKRKMRWLRSLLIIAGLWLFSLLAGAQPSILRSALMFTCIVLGESLTRRTSIYNTMSLSAFILLLINPYWLWDVGFQLSYAAVLSIIIFMRPIYNWFYIKNKALDFLWKMNAVTLAAQVLTVPLSIYHFHQFPNLFLLTNFLAVPLSSIILLAEILLCLLSVIPSAALLTGQLITVLIGLMNRYIQHIETIRFAVWNGLQLSLLQAILLILFASFTSYWLMERSVTGLKLGLLALLGFVAIRSHSFIQSEQQEKLIVYNVPKKRAVDIIKGRNYYFLGDSELVGSEFAGNFHLKPSRILQRISSMNAPAELVHQNNYLDYRGKHILLLGKAIYFPEQVQKPIIDLLILSNNSKLYIKKLAGSLQIKQVVIDGSVPSWKSNYYKKDCDSLKIPWHDVSVSGAFVMNLQ
ncbi:MAG: ComEC/Rec2 family competence protein [Chitinophagaceae bacterium]